MRYHYFCAKLSYQFYKDITKTLIVYDNHSAAKTEKRLFKTYFCIYCYKPKYALNLPD